MGTNFYLRPQGSTTDSTDEMIHLGKRSKGWTFLFRAYLDPIEVSRGVSLKVNDYASWRQLIGYGTIVDEYGMELRSSEMEQSIRALRNLATRGHPNWDGTNGVRGEFYDEDGNRFRAGEFC